MYAFIKKEKEKRNPLPVLLELTCGYVPSEEASSNSSPAITLTSVLIALGKV